MLPFEMRTSLDSVSQNKPRNQAFDEPLNLIAMIMAVGIVPTIVAIVMVTRTRGRRRHPMMARGCVPVSTMHGVMPGRRLVPSCFGYTQGHCKTCKDGEDQSDACELRESTIKPLHFRSLLPFCKK